MPRYPNPPFLIIPIRYNPPQVNESNACRAALLETATAVIELVSLLKGRKSPEGNEIDTGREE